MKKIRPELKAELLEKIDELRIMIDNEFLAFEYRDFRDLKNELENVQDELFRSL